MALFTRCARNIFNTQARNVLARQFSHQVKGSAGKRSLALLAGGAVIGGSVAFANNYSISDAAQQFITITDKIQILPTLNAASMERTFIMIKPDGVSRGLIADIIKRFEQRGYKLVAMKMMTPSVDLLNEHYGDLKGKPFFNGLVNHISSGPVVAMVWEGKSVVKQGRAMLGETDPLKSKPGSIRGDFSIDMGRNIIHGSDSVETANDEIKLWFKDEELQNWESPLQNAVYE